MQIPLLFLISMCYYFALPFLCGILAYVSVGRETELKNEVEKVGKYSWICDNPCSVVTLFICRFFNFRSFSGLV